jgi:hypothetical protein
LAIQFAGIAIFRAGSAMKNMALRCSQPAAPSAVFQKKAYAGRLFGRESPQPETPAP